MIQPKFKLGDIVYTSFDREQKRPGLIIKVNYRDTGTNKNNDVFAYYTYHILWAEGNVYESAEFDLRQKNNV